MNYRTTFHLLYRSWKGQQVIRWGRKGSDWVISFPAKEKRRAFIEIHCDVSPLIEDEVSAVVEYTDGSLFEFDGDIPADHPVNPLKKIPITQRRLDVGKIRVDYKRKEETTGFDSWDLKLTGKLLHGDFKLLSTDGVMYTLTRIKSVQTEAEEVPPVYIPLKASTRFEVDSEKEPYDLDEAFAWIKEQGDDVLLQPKPNGFRTILDTRAEPFLYFEGNDVNHADRYPDIMNAGKKLGLFVFDGELVSNSELYLFSMLFQVKDGKEIDLRGEPENERYKLVSQLKFEPPLFLMPSKIVSDKKELGALYESALQFPLSEGVMLKRSDATNLQKWTVQWAKIKNVIYRVGEVLGQTQVENRDSFVYELGFKDAFDNVISLGTSMTTSQLLNVGDHVIVSLPASGIWETPVIREKTDQAVDFFIPLKRVLESGTPLWVECENMEAEIPTASCSRLIEIQTRCMEIYNYDWDYESERAYALDVYQQAEEEHEECHAVVRLSQTIIDFGAVYIGEVEESSFTVFNDGPPDGDELFVQPTITRGGEVFSTSGSAWIPGGQDQFFPVFGTPLVPGEVTGTLTVSASVGSPTIELKVKGEQPTPQIGFASISPSEIDFGEVDIITGYDVVRGVKLTNEGPGGLNVDSTEVSGDEGFYRWHGETLDGYYNPGQTREMRVQFAPAELGPHEGKLVCNTDGYPSSLMVRLNGIGVQKKP